jgi:hypothetical protein
MKWYLAMSTKAGGGVGVNVPLMINAVVATSCTADDTVDASASTTAVSSASKATPTD